MRIVHFILVAGFVVACSEGGASPAFDEDLTVSSWTPSLVLPGTQLHFVGTGFPGADEGEMQVELNGASGSASVFWVSLLQVDGEALASCTITPELTNQLQAPVGAFSGTATIGRRRLGDSKWESITLPLGLTATDNLVPDLDSLQTTPVTLGDDIRLTGSGFLTSQEGQTMLVLDGQFRSPQPPLTRSLTELSVPLEVASRTQATLRLGPDLFGLYPGVFEGAARLVNFAGSGDPLESVALNNAKLTLTESFIDSVTPELARRGQLIHVSGSGFLPTQTDMESTTLLRLEGQFSGDDGKVVTWTGNNALLLFPDATEGNDRIDLVLRVSRNLDGDLEGLGLSPGVFVGQVLPELFWSGSSTIGQGFELQLRIAPAKQWVYVKFLPSCDQAFETFGLGALQEELQRRIVGRANAYYLGTNLEFTLERPADFVDYSVIEVYGEDPNGINLLGLDNTTGKDIGNLRFNDVIGGRNAESAEDGYYAYGGVFLESFLAFSPTLAPGVSDMAHPRFDDVFSAVCPQLGGSPATEDELSSGPRAALVGEAARVFVNLIGGTLAHEIGHSVGLAMVPGQPDEYHNPGDNPGWLMDSGSNRPFLERAELDGQGPEFFCEYNLEYLHDILPEG